MKLGKRAKQTNKYDILTTDYYKGEAMEETNFKKWGWWALGGIVLIGAMAAVIALTAGGPEPSGPTNTDTSTNKDKDDDKENKDKDKDKETDRTQTPPPEVPGEQTPTDIVAEDLPRTGPLETGIWTVLLAGIISYIMALSLSNVFRAAKNQ